MLTYAYNTIIKESLYWDAKKGRLMDDTDKIKVPQELRDLEKAYLENEKNKKNPNYKGDIII